MKTIEIISGAQKAQFTTKSVTLDGIEYFYINMSDVRNDKLNRVYTFVYDSEVKAVPYEEKDAKTLAVIFGQVRAMEKSAKRTMPPRHTMKGMPPQAQQLLRRLLHLQQMPPCRILLHSLRRLQALSHRSRHRQKALHSRSTLHPKNRQTTLLHIQHREFRQII